MVGVMTAKALAFAHDKPFLAINHLEGHALSVRLTEEVDVSLSAAAGVGRPLPAPHRARAGRLHAARHDHRRCGRRMLRQDRQASGPGLSRRAGGRAGGEGRRSRSASPCRGRCGASPAATSPSPVSRRRCARPSRSSMPGRHRRDRRSLRLVPAHRRRCPGRPMRQRARDRRRSPRSSSPAASRPTSICAAGSRRLPSAWRPSGRAADQALHRQRRHDRLGRHRAAAARLDRRRSISAPRPRWPLDPDSDVAPFGCRVAA